MAIQFNKSLFNAGLFNDLSDSNLLLSLDVYSGETSETVLYSSIDLESVYQSAGEYLEVDLKIQILFDCDSYSGESSEADLLTTTLLIFDDFGSGELALADLTNFIELSILNPAAEVSEIELTDYPQLSLYSYTGERSYLADNVLNFCLDNVFDNNLEFDVLPCQKQHYLSVANYSGETTDVDFLTYITIILPVNSIATGEETNLDIICYTIFDIDNETGEYSSVVFSTNPSFDFDIISNYTGEESDFVLATFSIISPISYSGEYSTSDLDIHQSLSIYPIGYTGEEAAATLVTTVFLSTDNYTGELCNFDITYIVNLGMDLPCFSGEILNPVDIATTYALSIVGYSGELTDVLINTTFAIYPNSYSGEYADSSLTTRSPITLLFDSYTGQYSQLDNLSTSFIIPFRLYDGAIGSATLTSFESSSLIPTVKTGEYSTFALQYSFQIPLNSVRTGESANITSITNDQFWRLFDGEYSVVTLTTEDNLFLQAKAGELGVCSLDTKPSAGIGTFAGKAGENVTVSLDALRSVLFYVYNRASVIVQVDIDSTTSFDLNTDSCCGIRNELLSNNHLILLEQAPQPSEKYDGDKIKVDFDLATQKRFSFDAYAGSDASIKDYSDYLDVTFETGCFAIFNFDALFSHRLCKGYFIPAGDWVVIELIDLLTEDCYVDRFYSGETTSVKLSDDIVLAPYKGTVGALATTEVEVPGPWRLNAYSGERLRFDFPWNWNSAYEGVTTSIKFYEPPINGYSGEFADVDLTIRFELRFKEQGCLDNSFIYQDENGDLIEELSNTVAIEGDPFLHDIQAECF